MVKYFLPISFFGKFLFTRTISLYQLVCNSIMTKFYLSSSGITLWMDDKGKDRVISSY